MLICACGRLSDLPDSLAEAAKARAASEGRTFTSLVEEGLRVVLDAYRSGAPEAPLPAYGDPAARFLVDPFDREAVWEALEADDEA